MRVYVHACLLFLCVHGYECVRPLTLAFHLLPSSSPQLLFLLSPLLMMSSPLPHSCSSSSPRSPSHTHSLSLVRALDLSLACSFAHTQTGALRSKERISPSLLLLFTQHLLALLHTHSFPPPLLLSSSPLYSHTHTLFFSLSLSH